MFGFDSSTPCVLLCWVKPSNLDGSLTPQRLLFPTSHPSYPSCTRLTHPSFPSYPSWTRLEPVYPSTHLAPVLPVLPRLRPSGSSDPSTRLPVRLTRLPVYPSYPSCTRLHPSCWHCPSTLLPRLLYCSSTVITAHMWLGTHPGTTAGPP